MISMAAETTTPESDRLTKGPGTDGALLRDRCGSSLRILASDLKRLKAVGEHLADICIVARSKAERDAVRAAIEGLGVATDLIDRQSDERYSYWCASGDDASCQGAGVRANRTGVRECGPNPAQAPLGLWQPPILSARNWKLRNERSCMLRPRERRRLCRCSVTGNRAVFFGVKCSSPHWIARVSPVNACESDECL